MLIIILYLKFISSFFYYIFLYNNIRYPLSRMATATKEKRKKLKANWDDATTDTFVKICVNETLAGN